MKARQSLHYGASIVLAATLFAAAQAADAATAAGTAITNQASATYLDSSLATRTATSNTVITTVQQVASVSMTAGAAKNAAPSGTATYAHSLTNNGNGADTFALTSSNSGAFSMTGVVFYADANGDGVADNATPITSTGSLAAGATFRFVAVATLPGSAANGNTNALVVTGTSAFNTGVAATSTDTTTVASPSQMDITANGSGAGALGTGAGAEASAVVTNTVAPGATTRFTLYLNNAGGVADTFNLAASTDGTFGTTTLPSGWTVVFKDSGGNAITSATVNAGGSVQVYADVTVPAGATNGTTDVYFRALSPTTGATDKIHDAVTVAAATAQVTLTKTQALDANCDGTADTAFSNADITAGAVPGACIRYQITASNTGATNVAAVVITDTIPTNTTYHAGAAASTTLGTILAPLAGAVGSVEGIIGILTPGQSASMSFGVKIN